MPVISGGGGGGNTTAQVVASGKVLPEAKPTGVTVDTTTYADPVAGSGHLTTLVFPVSANGSVMFAAAQLGDAFPRWLMVSDPTDVAFLFGDGTVDPWNNGNAGIRISANDTLFFQTPNGGNVKAGFNASAPDALPSLRQLSPLFTITSGALSTVQLVTATGAQISTTRDAETITPCTFNPGAATTATVTVALSPDNVTYSTLGIETEPAGVAFDGTIHLVKVRVPAGWYLKLTVNAQAALGLTTYY